MFVATYSIVLNHHLETSALTHFLRVNTLLRVRVRVDFWVNISRRWDLTIGVVLLAD